jgi:RNA polymerase sigma-54 factor
VTKEIIEHQKAFLDNGPEFIQPLKMEQIAEKVGVHVTTVSRAVDDKWVQTPRGVFSLKRFFGGGTKNAQTGEDVAWEKIRSKLQELIAAEDKAKPLSDEEIVKRFEADGLTIARRTVTKYREAMNIPSSRQRRQWEGAKA